MTMNNCNNNNNSSSNDVMSWVIVIICLVAFWPLGLVLLLRKISFSAKKNASPNSGFRPGQAPYQQQQASAQYQQYAPPQGAQRQQQQSQPGQGQQTSGQYRQPAPSQGAYKPAPTARPSYPPHSVPNAQASSANASYAQQMNYYAQEQAPLKTTMSKKPKKVKEK